MVFHIATGGKLVYLVFTFKLGEQILWHLAKGVNEHIQSASVGHANYYFLYTVSAALLNDLVEHGYQALATFQ